MRVFVTGGTGFIGRHLVKRLLAEGVNVTVLVRSSSKSGWLESQGVRIARGDLTILTPSDLTEWLRGVDVVYHLAAVKRPSLSKETFWKVNVLGTESVLRACVKAGVHRLIYFSSVAVHGYQEGYIDETFPYCPINPYAASKCEAERIALRFMKEHGLQVTIIRPSRVYGPGDLRSGIYHLFRAVKRKRFVFVGSGGNLIHLLYVGDLVNGIVKIWESERTAGQVYILADEKPLMMREFVAFIADSVNVSLRRWHISPWIARLMGRVFDFTEKIGLKGPLPSHRVEALTSSTAYNINKARKEINYNPQVDTREGIAITADWYIKKGYI